MIWLKRQNIWLLVTLKKEETKWTINFTWLGKISNFGKDIYPWLIFVYRLIFHIVNYLSKPKLCSYLLVILYQKILFFSFSTRRNCYPNAQHATSSLAPWFTLLKRGRLALGCQLYFSSYSANSLLQAELEYWSKANICILIQVVNYNHVMPTRYTVDIPFDKSNLNKEVLKVSNMTIKY